MGGEHSDEPTEAILGLLTQVARALGLDASVEIQDDGDTCTATLHGEDLGLFIGRHGQTIDAVQHLAQRLAGASAARAANAPRARESRRIVVDAEGYRERREEALQCQAEHAAEEALRVGRPVVLDAMTASERRLVHEYLRERGAVQTYSEGDEPDRHLVVAPLDEAD
jgi:spoIIIJ-associated protein